ncbi:MAG: NADP-dependent malic enzyme [Vampirovibrionales bacterium]
MELRRRYQGGIQTATHVHISNPQVYQALYGKANLVKACREVLSNPDSLYDLTCKGNLVAVITDGSAVLGLGNIGAGAGMPVMEGKSVLFKSFGAVEAFPICIKTQDTDEIVETVKAIAPIFGGINLEDIAAPRCFEIEERLIEETDIPIFHDDQHGTAVVCVAAILNALKAVQKPIESIRIVVNGAGASALSVSRLLLLAGVKDMIICDTKGAIYEGRPYGMNPFKTRIAKLTNREKLEGQLDAMIQGADVFIGLSVPGALSQAMVRRMNPDAIVLAMANPIPEILPHEALAAGAKIVGTGRSDFPNQVNNCLAFPGIFRGTLDVRAHRINDEMKLAAAKAIASCVDSASISQGTVIPSVFQSNVHLKVAAAVAQSAIDTGVARGSLTPEQSRDRLATFLKTGTWLSF